MCVEFNSLCPHYQTTMGHCSVALWGCCLLSIPTSVCLWPLYIFRSDRISSFYIVGQWMIKLLNCHIILIVLLWSLLLLCCGPANTINIVNNVNTLNTGNTGNTGYTGNIGNTVNTENTCNTGNTSNTGKTFMRGCVIFCNFQKRLCDFL